MKKRNIILHLLNLFILFFIANSCYYPSIYVYGVKTNQWKKLTNEHKISQVQKFYINYGIIVFQQETYLFSRDILRLNSTEPWQYTDIGVKDPKTHRKLYYGENIRFIRLPAGKYKMNFTARGEKSPIIYCVYFDVFPGTITNLGKISIETKFINSSEWEYNNASRISSKIDFYSHKPSPEASSIPLKEFIRNFPIISYALAINNDSISIMIREK